MLEQLQQIIMNEINYYNSDKSITEKTKRVNQSLVISKLASNYIQIENIKLRREQIITNNKDIDRKSTKHAN